ncbi:pectinesterase inhibitor 7-like [Humulus lupulus]|uniref:pectinesterase inhibitor 7-like n=1 Tax=Humulus lupulus TaxID=3486 RepID=UPI002B404B41|nr:pectinesterase inhibitor 7-like [Humulus lupulus]
METQRSNSLLAFLFFFFSLRLILAVGEYNYANGTNGSDFIRKSCSTTLYPDLCFSSLSRYASTVGKDPAHLARAAVSLSLSKTKHMAAYVSNVSRLADYGATADPRATAALHDCFSNFGDAVDEIRGSLKQMRHINAGGGGGELFRFQMSNVQTWMSAALTDQETCTDGFEDVSDSPVKSQVIDRVTEVKKHTSNALALVNRYAENSVP